MIHLVGSTLPVILAQGDVEKFPVQYRVACIILSGLFLWTFSIARDPRGWRRLYQTRFAKNDGLSVNKNKRIDEAIKKWGIIVSMFFLVADVTAFVSGITHSARSKKHSLTEEERFHAIDIQKSGAGRR